MLKKAFSIKKVVWALGHREHQARHAKCDARRRRLTQDCGCAHNAADEDGA